MSVIYEAKHSLRESFVTREAISGARAVCIESGGFAAIAHADSGLRMPAIGINMNDVLSGGQVNILMFGRHEFTSGMDIDFSGQVGRPIFVSSSGYWPTSTAQDDIRQKLGVALSGNIVFIQPDQTYASGAASIQSGANI